MKFDIWGFFEKSVEKNQNFFKNFQRITRTLHKDRYTFMVIRRSLLLRMKNFSDRIWRENQNTHFMFNNLIFRKSCRLWGHEEKFGRSRQAIDANVANARCMLDNKTINIYLQYVTLHGFPLQQWLRELASLLRYMYNACQKFLPSPYQRGTDKNSDI